jgi:integrase
VKPRKRARTLAQGLVYDEATRTAKISIYVEGRKGVARIRRTVHDVSKDEAMQAHASLRAKANRGREKPSAVAPTLQTFFDAYFELIAERISPSTASSYRQTAERYLLPRFGAWRLSDITAGAVNVWLLELKRARRAERLPPLAGATLNGYANILRAVVNYAVRFDVIEESPFKKAFDREKVNKPTNELSEAECAAFLGAFNDREAFVAHLRAKHRRGEVVACVRYPRPRVFGGSMRWDSEAATEYWERFRALRPFFVVALTTGLRLGDLYRLSWKDVRWNDGWIQLVMEKTDREVVIPISAACEASLRECRARPVVGECVFVDEAGAPLSVTRIRRTFAIAKQLAGITRTVRFHDLRHTYGSSLASEGLSLAIISKVMGHADQATTARYARPDARVLGAVRDVLNRRHGDSSESR